ncbi:MAG: hypothetical protein RLZZ612_2287 [Pseudomonadota bacterium]|jgi:nicotinamide riboside kinase
MWRMALLGAESTGKSTLALALAQGLRQHHPHQPVQVVDEHLRAWCLSRQRTPQAHEQAEIAHLQTQAIEAAVATGTAVIADTTPLMTAVYSEFYFSDTSLYAQAFAYQHRFDLHLLMGTDVAWQADGGLRDGPDTQQAIDALLRQRLYQAGVRFHTLYGGVAQRVATAWSLLSPWLNSEQAAPIAPAASGPYSSLCCAECSDPDCERALFSRLLSQRTSPSPTHSSAAA